MTCVTPLPVWRHLAAVNSELLNPQVSGQQSSFASSVDARLPAVNYFDLSASYKWNKVTARLGINNVLDKDPPLVGSDEGGNSVFYENNTFPSLYDTLGRHVFLSVSAEF